MMPLLLVLGMCSPRLPPAPDRASILSAYDPILGRGTLPGTRLQGELQVEGDWAFFLGNTVDGSGEAVTPPDGISSDTVILFQRRAGEWQVVDHGLGISDAFYLGWPDQHGAPKSLWGGAQD